MLLPDGRFKVLQRHVGGMLEWRTYRRIYEMLTRQPDLDAVEIGAARGAGSIAAAWAFRDLGRKGKLIVVEKFEGGSRAADGTLTENLSRAKRLFRQFGVADHIRIFPEYLTLKNGADAQALIATEQISAVIHDADGRIDRDFFLFWPRLVDGGFILADDYEDIIETKTRSDGSIGVFGKKLLTYRLLNLMRDWGLIEIDEIRRGTVFGHKPAGADFSRFDLAECESVIAEVRALCAQREAKEAKPSQ
jgi:hypothetical protein